MNQYFKPLAIGLMFIGLVALSGMSLSAVAQNQTGSNQTDNMTAGGGNMTLQEEGTSGINKTVARNQSAGGGGSGPSSATIRLVSKFFLLLFFLGISTKILGRQQQENLIK